MPFGDVAETVAASRPFDSAPVVATYASATPAADDLNVVSLTAFAVPATVVTTGYAEAIDTNGSFETACWYQLVAGSGDDTASANDGVEETPICIILSLIRGAFDSTPLDLTGESSAEGFADPTVTGASVSDTAQASEVAVGTLFTFGDENLGAWNRQGDATPTSAMAQTGHIGQNNMHCHQAVQVLTGVGTFGISHPNTASDDITLNYATFIAAAVGGTSYDNEITLAGAAAQAPSPVGAFNPALALSGSAGLAGIGSKVMNTVVSLTAGAALAQLAGLILEESLSLDASGGLAEGGTRDIPTSAALDSSAGITNSAIATLAAALGLSASGAMTPTAEAAFSALISLGASADYDATGILGAQVYNVFATLDASAGLTTGGGMVLGVSHSLSAGAGISLAEQKEITAALGLSSSATLTPSNLATLGAELAFGVSADIAVVAQQVSSAVLALGASAAQAQQAGKVITDALTLAVVAVLTQVENIGGALGDVVIATLQALVADRSVEAFVLSELGIGDYAAYFSFNEGDEVAHGVGPDGLDINPPDSPNGFSVIAGPAGNGLSCNTAWSAFRHTQDFLSMDGDYTISFWTIEGTGAEGATTRIMARSFANAVFVTVLQATSELGVQPDTGFAGCGFLMSSLSPGPHHIVSVKRDGASETDFYVDSVFVGTAFTSVGFGLGIFGGGTTSAWGAFDELRIYKRQLTQAQINRLFALGAPGSKEQLTLETLLPKRTVEGA